MDRNTTQAKKVGRSDLAGSKEIRARTAERDLRGPLNFWLRDYGIVGLEDKLCRQHNPRVCFDTQGVQYAFGVGFTQLVVVLMYDGSLFIGLIFGEDMTCIHI